MYGVSQEEITRLNPGSNDKIYAGQTLKIPQKKNTVQKGETFHTIQAGETLYRLSVTYNVSTKAICEANPGLSAENFRTGQVIRIPSGETEQTTPGGTTAGTSNGSSSNGTTSTGTSTTGTSSGTTTSAPVRTAADFIIGGNRNTSNKTDGQQNPTPDGAVKSNYKDMHKVKRGETVYRISRQYGITEQELIAANPELKKDGPKRGSFLGIPYPSAQQPGKQTTAQQQQIANATPPSNSEVFSQNKEKAERISNIQAAIVLPITQEKRMLEYYEGFLIAVDSLKRGGVSLDLYVYNADNSVASINTILAKPEMKKMDVIFGPLDALQVAPMATFAKKNDIRLVVPFSSKGNEVFNNPMVYLVNTPQSYLYSEVYEHFSRQFPRANVIFLESSSVDKDKEEFIKGLKQDLAQKGVTVKQLKETASVEQLKGAIDPLKENIFIPTSSSNITLTRIIPQLTLLVRDNRMTPIRLFGYPEWQMYTTDYLDSFFELDTYFYSSFYTNNTFPSAINFTNAYHKWYNKEMGNTFPKYGMLGFDTGYFFLKGLSRYGTDLENNISKMILTPVQTGFNFQRVNNWGGFVNKKVFFVHFTRDYELIKLDFE